jgi:hypothetical protein
MHRLHLALEAIDVQRQSLLFNSLSSLMLDAIEECGKNKKGPVKAFKEMNELILSQVGMLVNLNYDPSPSANACVRVPIIDRNHPLLIDWHREISSNEDGLKEVKRNKGVLLGGIDRATSKISGSFSTIPIDVYLTRGLFIEQRFTNKEITAILLHELGHVFTFLEYLGTNLTTNYVLQHISRSLLETRELKRKYEIIEEGSDILGIKLDDPEALTRTENETVIQTVILQEVFKVQYSELNSKIHDMTAWEMLSDQFSTRHGAGRDLVTGLDKIMRLYGSAEYRNTFGYLAVEAFKLLMFIATIPFFFGIPHLLMLTVIDPTQSLYDKPKSRMERIRRDMVDDLKNSDLDKNYQKQLVQDIEVIDKVLKEMTERRTLYEFFWTNTWSRKEYKQLKFQQELEMLINNDIFVKAAQLQSLSL